MNLQHSGLDLLAPLCLCLALSVSTLIMSMSLSMDVSAETGAAGSGSLDHLNDPDKRNRLATRSLCNLQQEIFAYRFGKDCRGYVHSSGLCTYAVLKGRVRWEFLIFLSECFFIFECVCGLLLSFSSLLACFLF